MNRNTRTTLRHTIPLAGETWKIEDLREGDVFHTTEDIAAQYKVVENKYPHKIIDVVGGYDEPRDKEMEAGIEVVFLYNVDQIQKP